MSTSSAMWSSDFGQFALLYEVVRNAESPEETLLDFLQTTYDAAARLAGWDTEALRNTFEPS